MIPLWKQYSSTGKLTLKAIPLSCFMTRLIRLRQYWINGVMRHLGIYFNKLQDFKVMEKQFEKDPYGDNREKLHKTQA